MMWTKWQNGFHFLYQFSNFLKVEGAGVQLFESRGCWGANLDREKKRLSVHKQKFER